MHYLQETRAGRLKTSNKRRGICSVNECKKPHDAKSFCANHYRAWKKYGDPLWKKPIKPKQCMIKKCDGLYYAKGYCVQHYHKNLRYGNPNYVRTFPDKSCSIKDCRNKYCAKGLCSKHYGQKYRNINPNPKPRREAGTGSIKNGYVFICKDGISTGEHRLVMEKKIKRKLNKHENIHHKNGVRDDNRLSNLEIFNTRQPSGQRPIDKMKFVYEMLELYAKDKDFEKIAKMAKRKKIKKV